MLSVLINARNEEKNLPRVIASVKGLADEIIVTDLESTDNTKSVAKKLGAVVYSHKNPMYVEPTRNFSIQKAKGDWILILDADEEVPKSLARKVTEIIINPKADYYRLPRKNIIFGKWIRHANWWPDFNIRLFKKGTVSWNEIIHSVPMTQGTGADLPDNEDFAIIHYNYENIDSYFEKMLRYTTAQSKNLIDMGYTFMWSDLLIKPLNEFLSRFFAGKGYKDGVHGLVLSMLQAFSELVLYIKLWNYKDIDVKKTEFNSIINKSVGDLRWWTRKELSWLRSLVSRS